MTKAKKLKICDWLLLVTTVVMLASSIQLEATGSCAVIWVWLHIIIGCLFFASIVSLGVFENNPSAIHCYEAAGFHRASLSETECYECLGEMWNCIEMEQQKDL